MKPRWFSAIALFFGLARCAPTPSSLNEQPPFGPNGLVYYGGAPVSFRVETRRLGFDPDGNANWLAIVHFFDAHGRPTRVMAGSDVEWSVRDATFQWQTRMRYGQPSAIIKTHREEPLVAVAHVVVPKLGNAIARTDTRTWHAARVVAQALGPYAIQIGWFPQQSKSVRVTRIDTFGNKTVVAVIHGTSSSFRDTGVMPAKRYRYEVVRPDRSPVRTEAIETPPVPPSRSLTAVSGKGMWLDFTTNPLDPTFYKRYDPRAVVEQAVRAGLRYVELRTAYGAYWEIAPEARPTIDAIIDGLAAHGIATIGWTIPRDTSFEDLRMAARTALYRTARGTRLAGIAVDLERGDDFMAGNSRNSAQDLWRYVAGVRQAIGTQALLIATVEDPYLEHIDNAAYPYARIARFAGVLQPMTYWRMMRGTPTKPRDAEVFIRASYAKIIREAGRPIPINIGGQTSAGDRNGAPSPQEVLASLRASRESGAIGECFFAWDGTTAAQWHALEAFVWVKAQ